MDDKVKIKRSTKKKNTFNVSFSSLTAGEVLSIYNSLNMSNSPVAADVKAYLENGIRTQNEELCRLIDQYHI